MENNAFPTIKIAENGDIDAISGGLTKREYFAGLAMQGLLTNPNIQRPDYRNLKAHKAFSNVCIMYADSLIEELNS